MKNLFQYSLSILLFYVIMFKLWIMDFANATYLSMLHTSAMNLFASPQSVHTLWVHKLLLVLIIIQLLLISIN